MTASPSDLRRELMLLRAGDDRAGSVLFDRVYRELRRVAARHLLRERREHTWHTTDLVNETYLRLVPRQDLDWQDRSQLVAVASVAIRRLLVEHARRRLTKKRGGRWRRLSVEDAAEAGAAELQTSGGLGVVELDDALRKLARCSARQARVVELRVFGQMTHEEIAGLLGVSARTVRGDWTVAKAWLAWELAGRRSDGAPAAGGGP